ncbi:alanine racemase [Sandarakinorhabdus sp.]|uniref:alanine racemase n=1 Tax=Sandarakinorhabdus sp. TaxID=1916663 RepID=UPI003F72C3C5
MTALADLETPSLLIDAARMRANLARMAQHVAARGGRLRPHVKTHKSADVLKHVLAAGSVAGITVSTLAEAEHFLAAGMTDILYAVGITPRKLDQIAALQSRGGDMKIILDSVAMAEAVVARAAAMDTRFKVLIELDVDSHRGGVDPHSDTLLAIARTLHAATGTELMGVMTHAGGSYDASSDAALRRAATTERDLSVLAAERLRAAGLPCPMVSIGSTPTALHVEDLSGITEVRAGVYTFFDLVQAGIGVCTVADIALSVLATVIGHQEDKGWAIVDAGWMAMSRDHGTERQAVDQGYGVVTDLDVQPLPGVIMGSANQEHGILMMRPGDPRPMPVLPIGSLVRILPNHACATAAQHGHYHVIEAGRVTARWARLRGW